MIASGTEKDQVNPWPTPNLLTPPHPKDAPAQRVTPMRRRHLMQTIPFLATPALSQGTRPLRFVAQANLTSCDPVWTTAVIVYNHA